MRILPWTIVNSLSTLMSPCAKGSHLIQKLEPAIERVYLAQGFGNNIFLAENIKKQVYDTQIFF